MFFTLINFIFYLFIFFSLLSLYSKYQRVLLIHTRLCACVCVCVSVRIRYIRLYSYAPFSIYGHHTLRQCYPTRISVQGILTSTGSREGRKSPSPFFGRWDSGPYRRPIKVKMARRLAILLCEHAFNDPRTKESRMAAKR